MSEQVNKDDNLLDEMRAYSDIRILNTIKQSNRYSDRVVENAKIIFEERGLGDQKRIEMIEKSRNLERKAFEYINDGDSPESVKSFLMNNGLKEEASNQIMKNIAAKLKKQKEHPKSKSKGQIVFIILIIIFVIKMVLRAMN